MNDSSSGTPSTPRRASRRAAAAHSSTAADRTYSPDDHNKGLGVLGGGILSSPTISALQQSPIPKITYSRRDRKRLASSPGKVNSKRHRQDSQSSSSDSDGDSVSNKASPTIRKKTSLSASVTKATATKARPVRPLPKRAVPTPTTMEPEIDGTLSDLSSLSELSDDEPSNEPTPSSSKQPPKAQGKQVKKRGRPKKRKDDKLPVTPKSVSAALSFPAPNHNDSWSLDGLGKFKYAWVLVDHKTSRVFDSEMDEDSEIMWSWWPGKVSTPKSTNTHMKVHLFGDSMKAATVKEPCEMNIRTRFDAFGKPRFDQSTFVQSSIISFDGDSASPRKKRRKDEVSIKEKWAAAVQEMNNDAFGNQVDTDEDEEMPTVAEAFMSVSQASIPMSTRVADPSTSSPRRDNQSISSKPSRPGRKKADNPDVDLDDGPWEPPPPEMGLQIPGEKVLGRLHASEKVDHWPARIEEYIPPANQKSVPKYMLLFLDGVRKAVPRSQFYTTLQEDAFGTCKMGQFQSYRANSGEFTDPEERKRAIIEDARRCPSPEPANPPPPMSEFCELSIREQFVYTKPVLRALLRDEFKPGRHRHQAYMAGGKERRAIVEKGAARGRMEAQDAEELYEYLSYWCLRNQVEVATREANELAEDEPSATSEAMDVDPPAPSKGQDIPPPAKQQQPSDRHEKGTAGLSTGPEFEGPDPTESAQPPPSSAPSSPSADSATRQGSPTREIDALSDLTPSPSEATELTSARSRPQVGCVEYELLSTVEKGDYCLNVLLPEAILQILLWRNGKRTSLDLLTPEEEQNLYNIAHKLLEETDWVRDIVRFREFVVQANQRKEQKKKAQTDKERALSSGTKDRSRRDIGKHNYRE